MKITVLAGGISTERDVSFSSGAQVYRALKELGHEAVLIDVFLGLPELSGMSPEEIFALDRAWAQEIKAIGEERSDIEAVINSRDKSISGLFGPAVIPLCQASDIVFLALHGGDGENGRIQASFDLLGIKYTGTGYISSAVAMDKLLTKSVLQSNNILVPKAVLVHEKNFPSESPFGYPCVVKVRSGGSSVGVYIVKSQEDFESSLKEAVKLDSDILVEEYIAGREFTAAVIDNKAMPVVEIAPISGFYDYKNKYQAGSTIETCPADISENLTIKIQKCAERVYEALDMESYARMDFRVTDGEEVYCLEANTLPGMTPTSLVPQEAKALGMSFAELVQKIVDVSLHKYRIANQEIGSTNHK